MAVKSNKPHICACQLVRSNFILRKVSYVVILLFTCTRAQDDYTATLREDKEYARLKEIYPELDSVRKEPEYFWRQSLLNVREAVRTYDETVDPIYQGMQNERNTKGNSYYEEDAGNRASENSSEPETPNSETFQAWHETVVDDRDTSEFLAGQGRPCSAGKICAQREESQALMIEALKRNILLQLKMTEPPNITNNSISYDSPPIRRLMKRHGIKQERLLDDLEDEYDDMEYEIDETAKETVISYARDPVLPGANGSFFAFNEQDLQYTVTKADIWFFMKANPTERTNLTIEFYRYQRNLTHPNEPPIEVMFDRKKIGAHKHDHWKEHIITHEVSRWFMHPDTNFGIDIRCPEVPGLVISGPTNDNVDKKPMLEVHLAHNTRSRRRKRDVDLRCDVDSAETRCCRYNFSISFQSMGWNWIISPRKYKSYYCSGDCPLFFLQSNQKRMLAMAPESLASSVGKPCCAPVKMDKMSMLYFDNEHNIVYSEVPDMIVKRCGCM